MKTVKEIMVTSPKYCGSHETLQAIAEQMSKTNIGSLPVLDKNKKVVGIITDRDICVTAGNLRKRNLSEIKVQEVLNNRRIYTCTQEDDVQTALKMMRTKKVGRLPVVDEDFNLTGIISLNRIMRKAYGSSEEGELVYAGEENVMNTLHSLANREFETAL